MYVVAKTNAYDSIITQSTIDFDGSLLDAYIDQVRSDFMYVDEDFSSIEEVEQFYFDHDYQISIIKI